VATGSQREPDFYDVNKDFKDFNEIIMEGLATPSRCLPQDGLPKWLTIK
jgi:hypothetical protein